MSKKIFCIIFCILISVAAARAQSAEVSVALSEQFFDALLEAIFKNFNAPEFPLAKNDSRFQIPNSPDAMRNSNVVLTGYEKRSFQQSLQPNVSDIKLKSVERCAESIRLLREVDNVKTAVRFREGKIYTPIAFSGSYNPPLVGCIDFRGWAEAQIDLEYDRQSRRLVGKVRILNVKLGGVTSLASGVLSRLVQASIDRKINPIEILQADKLSFLIPLQNVDGLLKMKAAGVRHEIANGVLNVHITYEFSKGN